MTATFIGKWCVYGHYVDGRCIYVGMGRPSRAFGNTPARPAEWSEAVKDGYDVELLSWHETQEECLAREIELIREIKPLCNKMHNGWVPDAFRANWKVGKRTPHSEASKALMAERQRRAWERGRNCQKPHAAPRIEVRCMETGEVFPSMTVAAAHIGVSIASLSASIAQRRSTAGHTFIKEPA